MNKHENKKDISMDKHGNKENIPPDPCEPKAAVSPIEELEAKVKDHWDQILRLRAEFENAKKRLERDKQEAIKYANEFLLVEILPVVDNFDRAMASLSEGHDPEKVKQGLQIAQDELHKILEEHGVEVIKSVGQDFDPRLHEAVAVLETEETQDGKVVDEIQRGYLLNGRLIRPSRVRIAKKIEETGNKP